MKFLTVISIVIFGLLSVQDAAATQRSSKARCEFLRSVGQKTCRSPSGYVVDHIKPLCAGGKDVPSNMQLQTKADSYKKDVIERSECRALKKGKATK